ncbi:MAG: hypothetical protein FWE53_02310 [Firmicutes bacterium]|nr:hypothetical protein [Bacillota bacterium]
MKRFLSVSLVLCFMAITVLTMSACSNRLGIPDGDFAICDSQGSFIASTENVMIFTVKGNKVTLHSGFNGGQITDSNLNRDGGIKHDSKHGGYFEFKTKQGTDLFGLVDAWKKYYIIYDKNTKIITLLSGSNGSPTAYYKAKTFSGGANPVNPSAP